MPSMHCCRCQQVLTVENSFLFFSVLFFSCLVCGGQGVKGSLGLAGLGAGLCLQAGELSKLVTMEQLPLLLLLLHLPLQLPLSCKQSNTRCRSMHDQVAGKPYTCVCHQQACTYVCYQHAYTYIHRCVCYHATIAYMCSFAVICMCIVISLCAGHMSIPISSSDLTLPDCIPHGRKGYTYTIQHWSDEHQRQLSTRWRKTGE